MKTTILALLQRRNRQQRWALALGCAVAGLALTFGAVLWMQPFGAKPPLKPRTLEIWLAGLAITACCAFVLRWWRGRAAEETARELDARWAAKNRLEAACELSGAEHALAAAQRAETERYVSMLGDPRPSRLPLWPLAGAAILLLALHAGTGAYWLEHAPARPKPATPVPPPNPAAEIKWKTPKPEIKATKIEEVPLVAEVRSDSGVHDLALEISVNGELKKTVPLSPDSFVEKGAHPLNVSIFLDEVGVEPFDVVSYDLRADRIFSKKLPVTASSLQFIQIRPFREDAIRMKAGGKDMIEALELIGGLKVAQLLAMKQNFVLAHSDLPASDATWRKENDRVGHEQKALAAKAGEIAEKAGALGMPAELVDLLTRAQPLMEKAGELVLATKNPEATPPQGKALGLITEMEKKMVKVLLEASGQGKPKPPAPPDPFKDEQKFALKPREKTDAGNLEKLARDQEKLVEDIAKAADGEQGAEGEKGAEAQQGQKGQQGKGGQQPGSGSGNSSENLAARQDEISRAMGQLLNDQALAEEALKHLKEAHDAAGEASQQFHADDKTAANEPAARALQQLRNAVSAMEKKGREDAAAALAQAQRDLNGAAAKLDRQANGEAPAKGDEPKPSELTAAAQRELREAARQQQQTGSGEGARRLKELAEKMEKSGVGPEVQKAERNPADAKGARDAEEKLDSLAQDAAGARGGWQPGADGLAQALHDLQRARQNLEHAERPAPSASAGDRQAFARELIQDVITSVQESAALNRSPEMQKLAGEAVAGARRLEPGQFGNVVAEVRLREGLDRLIVALQQAAAASKREEILAQRNPDEAPPEYRKPVADYFERLSKDYREVEK